ncbi:MAG: AAA family ATPase, partial [Dolichospermum sp.]
LAIIKIWDGEKEVEIKFLVCHNTYIENILKQDHEYKNSEDWKLSNFQELENITKKISKTEQDIEQLEKAINKIETYQEIQSDSSRRIRLIDLMNGLRNAGINKLRRRLPSIEELKEEVEEMLDIYNINLIEYYQEKEKIDIVLQKISTYLHEKNIVYICNYSSEIDTEEKEFVLCQIGDNLDINKAEAWLDEISNKVFLAAPISQVFLFTHHEYRRRFFEQTGDKNYDSELKMSKLKLPGFFTYDFAQPMITVFTNAINEDYRDAIKTEGEYGKRYKALLDDLNSFLVYKKVNISTDLSTIIFQLDTNDENIKLYPEDLSHGELKRLSIYLWLKYNKIEDAIVLMDEIEIGFHPDWQYEIIRDLEEWSPSNQYILATHSYQLCRALTPAHVRELEPKLIKSDNNIPL